MSIMPPMIKQVNPDYLVVGRAGVDLLGISQE